MPGSRPVAASASAVSSSHLTLVTRAWFRSLYCAELR